MSLDATKKPPLSTPAPEVVPHPDVSVHQSPIRCPFCHDEVRQDDGTPWVACGGCLARHHAACWQEGRACSTCGGATSLAKQPAARGLRRGLATFVIVVLMALANFGIQTYRSSQEEQRRHEFIRTLAEQQVRRAAPVRAPYLGETPKVSALRDRADAGDAAAMFDLGEALFEGREVAPERRTAIEWYRKAGAAGHADACLKMAELLRRGLDSVGIAKDLSEAAVWFRRAAEAGSAEGAYNYGRVGPAPERERWLRRAIEQGHVVAMSVLAGTLAWEGATAEEHAEAEALWQRAADGGMTAALTFLGRHVEERDPERALELFRRGAEAGDSQAMRGHINGLVARGRLEEAAPWIERAYAARNVGIREYERHLVEEHRRARTLAVGEAVEATLPEDRPRFYAIELHAGVRYEAVLEGVAEEFCVDLTLRDGHARVLDAPHGFSGRERLRRPAGRVEFTPEADGRFLLQIHGFGAERGYTIVVRPIPAQETDAPR